MPPVTVRTTGQYDTHRPAERGVLSFDVECTNTDKSTASSKVLSTAKRVREILTGLSPKQPNGEAHPTAAITHWSMGTLSTRSYRTYERGGDHHDANNPRREFEVCTAFEVKFKDFAKLSSVAADLSAMDLVSVRGVSWRLTDATKAGLIREARKLAARDAMERARDYASTFGYEKLEVTEITEDQSNYWGVASPAAAGRRMMKGGEYGGGGELSFQPEDVPLSANVTVTFSAQ